jgi:hypothetical protein
MILIISDFDSIYQIRRSLGQSISGHPVFSLWTRSANLILSVRIYASQDTPVGLVCIGLLSPCPKQKGKFPTQRNDDGKGRDGDICVAVDSNLNAVSPRPCPRQDAAGKQSPNSLIIICNKISIYITQQDSKSLRFLVES